MSRRWNGKALIDELGNRVWDTSATFREKIIEWANEIQNDLTSDQPLDYYRMKLKKLLPTEQDEISLDVEVPAAATAAIGAGGSLVDTTKYKAYVSFRVYDEDAKRYIESEASPASSEVTATATDKQIDLSAIPLFSGDTTVSPATIHRVIYISKQAATDTVHGEPFFSAVIEDNTTTTATVTTEPTSTITPISDSELDQVSAEQPVFTNAGRALSRVESGEITRYSPSSSTSTTPDTYSSIGTDRIRLFPKLSSTATEAQRTFTYYAHRRPHEIFYDVDRKIDMPISLKKALMEGVVWKAYEYRDRDGVEGKLNNYQQFKTEAIAKITRNRRRPGVVRDISGDTFGFEV